MEPWKEGRRWQIFMLDAYGPGLTRNVQNKAWEMGYVCITHGGGASQVLQTNDTDLHKPIRQEYTELESMKILALSQEAGGKMRDLTEEDCINFMIDAMSNPKPHLLASDGFKLTGLTVALDGSEDHLIKREAKEIWDMEGMRERINRSTTHV